MNKVNVALFFAALMVIGACAEPRKLLATTEGRELVEAEEHQRILAELEEVHQLRERMLQEGKTSFLALHARFGFTSHQPHAFAGTGHLYGVSTLILPAPFRLQFISGCSCCSQRCQCACWFGLVVCALLLCTFTLHLPGPLLSTYSPVLASSIPISVMALD